MTAQAVLFQIKPERTYSSAIQHHMAALEWFLAGRKLESYFGNKPPGPPPSPPCVSVFINAYLLGHASGQVGFVPKTRNRATRAWSRRMHSGGGGSFFWMEGSWGKVGFIVSLYLIFLFCIYFVFMDKNYYY